MRETVGPEAGEVALGMSLALDLVDVGKPSASVTIELAMIRHETYGQTHHNLRALPTSSRAEASARIEGSIAFVSICSHLTAVNCHA